MMLHKLLCKAFARSTGQPCKLRALRNGRCRLHGGLSTGPRTPQGKAQIAKATKQRMADGQTQLAKDGFQRWLNSGGRKRLSILALKRNKLNRMVADTNQLNRSAHSTGIIKNDNLLAD